MVPSIIDVLGYDREFCSSSSSTNVTQKLRQLNKKFFELKNVEYKDGIKSKKTR